MSDGECIHCGESGNWCRCDEIDEMSQEEYDQEFGNRKNQNVETDDAVGT